MSWATEGKPYPDFDEWDKRALVSAARRRVHKMNEVDGGIHHEPMDLRLRTILSALACGINLDDWTIVADALVMLQDLELEHRR